MAGRRGRIVGRGPRVAINQQISALPYLFRTHFNCNFNMVGEFFQQCWCIWKIVFSMVLHLKKVSSKNSNQIKSFDTFKMGYKWRHLLPVDLVPEGFHEITSVHLWEWGWNLKKTTWPPNNFKGWKFKEKAPQTKARLGLIWGKPKLG